ncbi:hypothetical protein VTI74DRAFT_2081 [Chaetomium olivicolor]
MTLPETVDHKTITPQWLNNTLGIKTISSLTVTRIGENQGFTDPIYRIHLNHTNNDVGPNQNQPKTLVLKVTDPTSNPSRAAAFVPLHTREVLFYNCIAPILNLDTIPRCYHASFDEATLCGTILLQDLGAPIHEGSFQLATVTVSQAMRVMADLGRFQGTCLAKRFQIQGDLPRPLERTAEEIRGAFPVFEETWGKWLGEKVIERYRKAVERYEGEWVERKGGFLQGLVHGDCRLGNVLFCRDGEGLKGESGQPGVDRNAFEQAIQDSIATRHVGAPGQASEGTSTDRKAITAVAGTSDGQVVNGMNGHTAPPDGVHSDPSKHGHLHHDQGSDDEKLNLSIIDWQTVSRGPAVFDVAYFLAMSLQPEVRRTCEFDLVYTWYKACRDAAGPTWIEVARDYSVVRCVREISMACIAVVLVSVTTLNHFKAPDVVMRAVGEKLKAVSEMLVDWGSLER